MHQGRCGDYSALHWLAVNDVLIESAMFGDPLACDIHLEPHILRLPNERLLVPAGVLQDGDNRTHALQCSSGTSRMYHPNHPRLGASTGQKYSSTSTST